MKRKVTLSVLAIMITILICTGITYSYYAASIKELNKTETVINAGNGMDLIYTGVSEIVAENMIPGDGFTKTFSVENKGNSKTKYNIYLENVTNEFNEDLVYTLSDDNGVVIEETRLPETSDKKIYLKTDIEIGAKEKQNYKLKIEYKYLADVNQSAYMGSQFKGNLGIDTNQSKDENSSKFKVGDYVIMTPTSTNYKVLASDTGYENDQTINPSELNLWRVIRINEDNTVDMVSENVSSAEVYFKGFGIHNFVAVLNDIAKQYENTEYTVKAKSVGDTGQSQNFAFDDSYFFYKKELSEIKIDDIDLIQSAISTLIAETIGKVISEYWLASRWFPPNAYDDEYGLFINSSGILDSKLIYQSFPMGGKSYEEKAHIRPIITLKAGLMPTGNGTSEDPYQLN